MISAESPLVSIVIPVYNQELHYMQESLQSALSQDYPNVEVVVSNNHSTNGIEEYLKTVEDTRLRIVKPPDFLPMVKHFQFAADQAAGEFILFLCSDDWVYPHCVSTLMPSLIADPKTVISYGEIECINNNDLKNVKFYYNRKRSGHRSARESLNELLKSRPVFGWIPGGIMRRSAYEQVRDVLSGQYTFSFDFALLFRLHEVGDLSYVDKPISKFRFWTPQHGKSGGDRMAENLVDVGRLCTLLESPRLVSLLDKGVESVNEWRLYQAKRWVLNLLVNLITDNITAEKCRLSLDVIQRELYPDLREAAWLKWLIQKPQAAVAKPLFGGMYYTYLLLQKRLKVGL